MNIILKYILLVCSMLFFIAIINMIAEKKLSLKYALIWLITSIMFIIISIFPLIVYKVSYILHIKEPVNALFLIIIFFLMVIIFTLTIALSRNSERIKTLVQELGLLKLKLDNLNEDKGR